jgi:hypothetical protein
MPRCQIGNHSVPADDLRRVGTALACSDCRKLKGITGDVPMAEENCGSKCHPVVAFNIHEVSRPDGSKDHMIEAEVGLGTLNMKWEAKFDQIRDFFTKRREGTAKKKNPLTAV